MQIKQQEEYTKLADIYDAVMEEVNYEYWADYIDSLILQHHDDPKTVLELACGTGSLSLSLDELGCYEITGTDKSEQMIRKAKQKNEEHIHHNVIFSVMDFLHNTLDQKFDIVFSVFDSINYLHSPQQILKFLQETQKVLKPDSLLIFDFTTPKNSLQAIHYLNNEEGYTEDNYRFFRKSRYDSNQRIHTNEFHIEKLSDDRERVLKQFREVHRQKIYTLQQMLDIIGETAYKVVAKYSDFEFEEADENSLRITMVLQCPSIPS